MIGLRLWAAVHGHLGVLAVVALVHPAVLLWSGRPLSRGGRLSLGLSTLVTVAAFVVGLAAYGDYRAHVKRDLFHVDPRAGLLFETKEHLAYAALALTLGGFACAWLAPTGGMALRRTAARLFAAAVLLTAIVAGLGTYVAAVRGF